MRLANLRDLFVMELQDLYDAEHQILKALPKMEESATAPELKSAFRQHRAETEQQVERLEQIFRQLGKSAKGKSCKATAGLIAEGEELMRQKADPAVTDAGLIASAQKIEHYEIAGYGTVRTYAQMLGDHQSAQLLQQTLDEEGMTDKKLTQLAERVVNIEAEMA